MTKPDLMPLAEEERADLLALLRKLTPAQWEAQSLCTEWRVQDVATHVVSYDELSKALTVATFVRGGLRTGKVNEGTRASTRTESSTSLLATSAHAACRPGSKAGSH